MAEQRVKGFENVPNFKERGIDLSLGTWRGIGAPKGTPKEVIDVLTVAATQAAKEPSLKESMDKLSMAYQFANGADFKAMIDSQERTLARLVPSLHLNN